jgi:hypothetical protein
MPAEREAFIRFGGTGRGRFWRRRPVGASRKDRIYVVAVTVVGPFDAPAQIEVEFYHCKYSKKAKAGARLTGRFPQLTHPRSRVNRPVFRNARSEAVNDLRTKVAVAASQRTESARKLQAGRDRADLETYCIVHDLTV